MSIRETGSSDLNYIIDQFNCVLKDSLDQYAPLCSRNIVVRDVNPWYNDNRKKPRLSDVSWRGIGLNFAGKIGILRSSNKKLC